MIDKNGNNAHGKVNSQKEGRSGEFLCVYPAHTLKHKTTGIGALHQCAVNDFYNNHFEKRKKKRKAEKKALRAYRNSVQARFICYILDLNRDGFEQKQCVQKQDRLKLPWCTHMLFLVYKYHIYFLFRFSVPTVTSHFLSQIEGKCT